MGTQSLGSSSWNHEVAVGTRRIRRILLVVVMACLLVGGDRVEPQVEYYVGQGFRVGYPAGWRIVVEPGQRLPVVMTAKPPRHWPGLTWWPFGWWAEYQVSLLPHAASLEDAVEEYLKSARDASDFVLEGREKVVVGASAPGYVLRSFYVEYAPDMESFPTGETVLLTVTERGQLLKVRYTCARQRCGFEEVAIRSVMKSVVPT
jgi:hypothetical protein